MRDSSDEHLPASMHLTGGWRAAAERCDARVAPAAPARVGWRQGLCHGLSAQLVDLM